MEFYYIIQQIRPPEKKKFCGNCSSSYNQWFPKKS